MNETDKIIYSAGGKEKIRRALAYEKQHRDMQAFIEWVATDADNLGEVVDVARGLMAKGKG